MYRQWPWTLTFCFSLAAACRVATAKPCTGERDFDVMVEGSGDSAIKSARAAAAILRDSDFTLSKGTGDCELLATNFPTVRVLHKKHRQPSVSPISCSKPELPGRLDCESRYLVTDAEEHDASEVGIVIKFKSLKGSIFSLQCFVAG